MRAVTWIEFSQITSILFKASLPALWVLTLSNSISQPQYCAAIKLTSKSAIFPGNIDSMLHCIARHCQMSILNSKLLKVQSCHGWNEKSKYFPVWLTHGKCLERKRVVQHTSVFRENIQPSFSWMDILT